MQIFIYQSCHMNNVNHISQVIKVIKKKLIEAKRIHIIPVGIDPDRVIKPLKSLKPDIVYLITNKDKDLFAENVQKSKEYIEMHIHTCEKVVIKKVDIYDFYKYFEIVASIFNGENSNENQILFNISTGSKIHSIIGILACEMFKGQHYYVKKDYEQNMIPDTPEILSFRIPSFYPIERELVHFLVKIKEKREKNPNITINKKECLFILKEINNEFKGFSDKDKMQKWYNKLNRDYFNHLIKENYLYTRGKSFNIKINEEKWRYVKVLAIYYGFINLKKDLD